MLCFSVDAAVMKKTSGGTSRGFKVWPLSYFKLNSTTDVNVTKTDINTRHGRFYRLRYCHMFTTVTSQDKPVSWVSFTKCTKTERRNIFFAPTRHPCLLLRDRWTLSERLESITAAALCFQLHHWQHKAMAVFYETWLIAAETALILGRNLRRQNH